jgi:YesN/AraC family two-component response regulator
VLVVDDEVVVRRSLGRLLSRLGYEPIQAESAAKALAVLDESEVDVVLTDVVMPEMNGLELAQELEKRPRKPRVVFMSGYSDGILTRQGDVEQRLRYLQKPISAEGLKRCLREMAEESQDEPTGT